MTVEIKLPHSSPHADQYVIDLLLVLRYLNPLWIHYIDSDGRIISKERGH